MSVDPFDDKFVQQEMRRSGSGTDIHSLRSIDSSSQSHGLQTSYSQTLASQTPSSPKARSLRRPSSTGSWASRSERASVEQDAPPVEHSLEQHAPASVYGVPAYLEPPDRPIVKMSVFGYLKMIVKSIFSAALVIVLIFGYTYSIKVIDLHVTTVGIYGTILMADFLTQYSCAICNRWDVVNIVRRRKAKMGCPPERRRRPWQVEAKQDPVPEPSDDPEKQGQAPEVPRNQLMNPDAEISIAVVGYREDEQAWKECLRSLQKQKLKPKCVVGVVDGNDQPDLDMANAFMEEFANHNSLMVHLPVLLSAVHRKTYFDTLATYPDSRSKALKAWHRISGHHTEAQKASLAVALNVVLKQVDEWEAEYKLSSYEALCFSQPHGHKRTAMFTAFAISLWALKTKHAIFTTDSDTLVKDDALDEMLTILQSHGNVGGVTGDVKIWNRAESFLARLCAVRYWFAFNIERACQSWWRCVSCLSGPMSMYRSHDLHVILGLWNIQTYRGKETTFGDDRHLTNQILAQGFKTRYTHRTWCESESPTQFPRWVKQQTRWSKSFFREAFWFPHAFSLHSWWMLVEITKQSLYPFILVATVFRFLFEPTAPFRPVIWLVTMFGIAFVKSTMAVIISADLWLMVFSLYGFVYFFGLLPSKIFALLTMNKTTWGTSARSASEIKIGATFIAEFYHLGHLCLWYLCTTFGLAYFCSVIFKQPLLALAGFGGFIPCYVLFNGIPNPLTPFKFVWAKITKVAAVIAAVFASVFVRKSIKLDDTFTEKPPSVSDRPARPARPAPIIIVDEPVYEDEKKLISPWASPVKMREKRSDSTASMTSVDVLPLYRSRANSAASMMFEQPKGRSKRANSVASMMLDKQSFAGRERSDSISSPTEKAGFRWDRSDSIASTSQGPSPRYKRSNSDASTMTFSAPPRYRSDSVASTAPTYMPGISRRVSVAPGLSLIGPEKPSPTKAPSSSLLERPGMASSPLRASFVVPSDSPAAEAPSMPAVAGRARSKSFTTPHSPLAPSGLRDSAVGGRPRAYSRPQPRQLLNEDEEEEFVESEESDASSPRRRSATSLRSTDSAPSSSAGSTKGRKRSNSARAPPPPFPGLLALGHADLTSPSAAASRLASANPFLQAPATTASLFADQYRVKRPDGEHSSAFYPSGEHVGPLSHTPSQSRRGSTFGPAMAGGLLNVPHPARMRSGSITASRAARHPEALQSRTASNRIVWADELPADTAVSGPSSPVRVLPRSSSLSPSFTGSDSDASSSTPQTHPVFVLPPARDPFSEAYGAAMDRDGEYGSTQSVASQKGYAF
ncbi:hypothetical protein BCV69DRAFT_285517 [Microstroma glucosiphilum]|uniref:Glycosyltransferase 2-like domain-containing protein n=1 Tax=Pseudomicrostroma glucosiphilum TaxID=1684307 RepID=A0A316U4P7_9BASI|nr:hypothetical protein BCV69DRAFT_285517 [Pseudomicrostroma glucosiphilum]PWN17925.1 hypothetical protein BCV69DRAFT_285517 [Pseudomicrostroma glucosiphilum]